jgi:restriction system protein
MTIPTHEQIMLPILKICKDGNEHIRKELVTELSDHYKMTEEERQRRLPSGSMTYIYNRVGWAKLGLLKAELLNSPKRGVYKITDAGLNLINSGISELNSKYLYENYEPFRNWKSQIPTGISDNSDESIESTTTPQELIEISHKKINEELSEEILEVIKNCSPDFFERLVVKLLQTMGYGHNLTDAGKVKGGVGDGGIDGIIDEDKLGLDQIYIQAKRWQGSVGSPEIQKFIGALTSHGARKGVFITTSHFTSDAKKIAESTSGTANLVLIDGNELSKRMIENNVGVSIVETYHVKRIDNDFFNDEVY